jgi:flagellar hook-associated protein 2
MSTINLPAYFTNFNSNTAGNASVDVYAKVSKIMQSQNTIAPKLNTALTVDKTVLSGLGQLQSALASFQGVAQSVSGNGLNLSASSSAANVVSAVTSNSSATGTYAIQVNQLAQGQVLQSNKIASPDLAIGLGASSKIVFEFGTTSGNTFTKNAAINPAKTVVISSGNNTLQGIASAINEANIGVSAKVISSGTGYALELNSPTGASSSMRINVSGDSALQNLLTYNPAGIKNLNQAAASQDATLTINGTAISSPSNTLTKALPGTTLNLTSKGTSELVVAQGSTQVAKNVTDLVNAYNTLNAKLSSLQQGELKADGSALRTQSQLKGILASSTIGSSSTPAQALAKIGITTEKNGSLTIDASKLHEAISSDPASVAKLFTNGATGIADHLDSQIQGMLSPVSELSKKVAAVNQDITTLNTKKSSLEKALTTQANALVKLYSQQNTQGSSAETSSQPSNIRYSLFNYLA